jgi:hypothetical protein
MLLGTNLESVVADVLTLTLVAATTKGHLEIARKPAVGAESGQSGTRELASCSILPFTGWAAHNDHLEVAKLLMSYAADLNAKTKQANQSVALPPRRSSRPSATSPDAAKTTATSELPSRTKGLTKAIIDGNKES